MKKEVQYEAREPCLMLPTREVAGHTWVGNTRGVVNAMDPCIISVSVQVASVDEESNDDQAESERASVVDSDEHQPLPRLIDLGASIGAVQRYLNWNEASQAITWVKRVCGVLVICRGGYSIYLPI